MTLNSSVTSDQQTFYQRHLLAEALCGHSLWRDIQHAAGELPGPIVFKDELRALRSQLGKSHEDQWIERLIALGVQVVEIGQTGSDEEREARTLDAIKQSAEAIHAGRISHGRWNGEPDLLIRSDVIRRLTGHATLTTSPAKPTSIGSHRYEAADVKLSGELAVTALLQVALYAELIDAIQGIAVTDRREHQMHFFLGAADDEDQVATKSPHLKGLRSLSAAAFGAYTRRHMQRVESAWDAVGESLPKEPEPVKYCDRCSWERNCDAVWRDKRDLILVAGLRKDERRALRAEGISTVGELATAGDVAERAIPVRDRREHLMRQADLQEKSLDLPEPLSELRPPTRGIFEREEVRRGFAALPTPAALNIYMDFERYDFNEREEGGLETRTVLTGFVVNGPNLVAATGAYQHALAETPSQEEHLFVNFVTQLSGTIARAERDGTIEPGGEVPVFHFSPFEPSTFKRLADEYGIGQDVFQRLRWVDLRDITVRVATIGVERYSLKEIEQITKFSRTIPLKEVKLPAIAYFKYLIAEDPEEKQANLNTLRGYNEDDCRSLIALHAWLESIRAAYVTAYPEEEWAPLPRPAKVRKTSEQALSEQEKRAALRARLKAAEAAHRELTARYELEGDSAKAQWHRWCADLTGFDAREKTGAFFDQLQETAGHALLDQPKSIGHITPVPGDGYTFPEQLVTLEPKDGVEAVVGSTIIEGKITALDLSAQRVWINWDTNALAAHPTYVTKSLRQFSSEPEEAMADFSEAAIDGPSNVPRVTRNFLYRASPLCLSSVDSLEAGVERGLRAAMEMREGDVLVVQGPPGTGKSFLGGTIIRELVLRGEKVAVTAQAKVTTHIPIGYSGVDAQLVRVADSGHVAWKHAAGEKLSNWLQDQSGAVVGGTRWTFSNLAVAGAFDVVIVDEASQFATAHLVALSRCAKKIILLGDPQQLPMVTQGHHPPGPSGISTMAHWLGDDVQTVQPADGVFLERTYRLHPTIADFIGDTFYEGRLTSALPEQENQAVTLDGESAPLGPL
ncbi:MAG: TM0106 family RecB-like putative nuclease, partial [Betaproteobacteria bacterium]|nr:TM0106 family RecB-like putative nuclease [Betaproteobacteria bacterium]